ncbi:MAG: hypothetical protein PF637_14130 [Spirochaetes bacterium]|jgi:hypothetical protein|nr:hypothetical protein [Spirochaetota bacterium]
MRALYRILAAFNRYIERMPVRQRQMIRQSFGMLIFIAVIAGVIVGVNFGKKAANKGGVPLINSTRDIFEIDISRQKERITFDEMIEDDQIIDRSDSNGEKRIMAESADIPLSSSNGDEIVEKELPARTELQPIASDKMPEPMSDTETKTEESLTPTAPSTAGRDDDVLIPESRSLMSDSPGSSKLKEDTNSSDEWSPTGENESDAANITPLNRNEEIFE